MRLAVEDGAVILDQTRPGWVDRVNLTELDMAHCMRCVIGQLAGTYDDGLVDLGLNDYDAYAYGFATVESYPDLTEVWRDLIRARRGTT